MSSFARISTEKLSRLVGTPGCPVVVDVRAAEDFAADSRLIPGSIRRPHDAVPAWAPELAGRTAIVVCQRGQKLSEGTAAWLDVSSQHGTVRNALQPADAPGADDDTVELHAHTSWGDILIRRPSSTPAR